MLDLAEYAETCPLNRIEMGDPEMGIIASGRRLPVRPGSRSRASFLKLGLPTRCPAS